MTSKPIPPPALVGFPLSLLPDDAGELHFPSPEASVRQGIQAILSTRPGERLMRPDFGAGLESMLHEPNTPTTRRRIRDLVAGSLARWEPRAIVDRVDVLEVAGAPSAVRVEVAYRLRRTGAPQQLGLTMELGG
ncbi:GPW/gp25 family protein [Sorangium sp. So ce388]|uniref:GPW/gp25 family protein n=1 Tax=Sorangium sp. So ce388 TaxID=3133309 RepID=UPI003F5B0F36